MKKPEDLEFKELEQMLSRYKWYLKEAKLLELSIRYPTREENNVGGGKPQPHPDSMLRTIIKLEEDDQLQEYISIGKAIEKTYANLPEYLQKAMKEFYIDRRGPFRGHARDTAARLNVDARTLYRWRLQITQNFLGELKKDVR